MNAPAPELRDGQVRNDWTKAEIAALKSGNPVAVPMMMMAMTSQDPPPKPKDWP